mgnify:CR=1 FL=1
MLIEAKLTLNKMSILFFLGTWDLLPENQEIKSLLNLKKNLQLYRPKNLLQK